ncbi:MAG: hypothetical protein ACT4P2_14140 [Pseudomonadota bacterium]
MACHLRAPGLAIRHILAGGSIEEHDAAERRLLTLTGESPPPLLVLDPQAVAAAIERAYETSGRRMFGRP